MAYATTQITHDRPSRLARSLSAIGRVFLGYAEARSHYREIQTLQAKSDAELAELGIAREEIVHHVCARGCYL